jgi:hypothetical protein
MFENRPIDKDTAITSSKKLKIQEFDALHENWIWDGVKASSVVLVESQLAGMKDEQLSKMVAEEIAIGSNFTISRDRNGYCFINFGFKII